MNEVLIDRYPSKIANEIKRLNLIQGLFLFILKNTIMEESLKNLPEGSLVFYIPSLDEKKIKLILKNYPALSLTTIAQRIPDMWILSLFNHLSIPTSIVQHGLWSDKLQRVAFFTNHSKIFKVYLLFILHKKNI